jgi:hypothetical protein
MQFLHGPTTERCTYASFSETVKLSWPWNMSWTKQRMIPLYYYNLSARDSGYLDKLAFFTFSVC